jgi:hypothetical protein
MREDRLVTGEPKALAKKSPAQILYGNTHPQREDAEQ